MSASFLAAAFSLLALAGALYGAHVFLTLRGTTKGLEATQARLARAEGELEMILSRKERESFRRALEDDFDSIMTSFSKVDLQRSDTRNPKDKEMILAAVEENIGMKELNARVKAMLREWLAKTARAPSICSPRLFSPMSRCSGNDERSSSALDLALHGPYKQCSNFWSRSDLP
mgnify:CR=1 FL=1